MEKSFPRKLYKATPERLMYDILTAAQNTQEWAAVHHHTAFKIPNDDELKLQAVHVRARAEEVILALNELVERIEKGEIGVKDFASRAFFSRGVSDRRIRRQSRKAGG